MPSQIYSAYGLQYCSYEGMKILNSLGFDLLI